MNQLDANYETRNANYENQYPTLTDDQLDSVDLLTGFDEFKKFREFESLFSGYVSKRSQLETIENTWLTNNFNGTHPDTLDDAENTIFNSNYQLKIGTALYQMKTDGLYNITGGPVASGNATTLADACFSNHHNKKRFTTSDGSKMFKLKVAINSWLVRSGAKGKVVSFKNKNGNWKRSRARLAVSCGGTILNNQCAQSFTFSDRNPSPSDFKKRRQLKVARHVAGQIWRTKKGMLVSSFDFSGIYSASIAID